MKKIIDFIFNLKIFILLYLFCNLLSLFIYTKPLYNLIIPVIILWGGAIIVYGYINKKIKINFFSIIALMFCINYFIVIIFKSNSKFTDIAQLISIGIYFLLFFEWYSNNDEEKREDILLKSSYMIFLFNLIISIGSTFIMFFNYSNTVNVWGKDYKLGLIPRSSGVQLHSLAGSPTSLAILELVSLIASLYIWKKTSDKRVKFGTVTANIFTWLCLVGANANNVILMFFAFSFFILLLNLLNKRFKKLLLTLVVLVSIASLYQGTLHFLDFSVNGVRHTINSEINSENSGSIDPGTSGEDIPDIKIERTIGSSTLGVRLNIWKEGIKLFGSHPLGIAKSNISVRIFYGVPNYEYKNLHNGYLTILVASGVQGLVLVLVFGVTLFVIAIKSSMKMNSYKFDFIFSYCAAILAGDMVNACFLFDRGLLYMTLWVLLGYIWAECKKVKSVTNGKEEVAVSMVN